MIDDLAKKNYCLIDGVFEADHARQVLLTLIDDKISFHQRNDLSHRERFGEPSEATGVRISQLEKTRQELTELVEFASKTQLTLKIGCDIRINLISQ